MPVPSKFTSNHQNMSETVAYKYVIENSHTFIQKTEWGQKEKVVTGEVVNFQKDLHSRARLFLAWFKAIDENWEVSTQGTNDAVASENKAKAKKDAEAKKKADKEEAEKNKAEEKGVEVPEIVVPQVETEIKNDGDSAINIKVK